MSGRSKFMPQSRAAPLFLAHVATWRLVKSVRGKTSSPFIQQSLGKGVLDAFQGEMQKQTFQHMQSKGALSAARKFAGLFLLPLA